MRDEKTIDEWRTACARWREACAIYHAAYLRRVPTEYASARAAMDAATSAMVQANAKIKIGG